VFSKSVLSSYFVHLPWNHLIFLLFAIIYPSTFFLFCFNGSCLNSMVNKYSSRERRSKGEDDN